jgi:hypothetical protein
LPKAGDYESSCEPDEETLERHYRVTLNFRLLVRAIRLEFCRESFYNADSPLPEALTGVGHFGPICPDGSVRLPSIVELVGETSL